MVGGMLTFCIREIFASSNSPTMIPDNPASDIAGANAASWNSILVRTGVYDPAEGKFGH